MGCHARAGVWAHPVCWVWENKQLSFNSGSALYNLFQITQIL